MLSFQNLEKLLQTGKFRLLGAMVIIMHVLQSLTYYEICLRQHMTFQEVKYIFLSDLKEVMCHLVIVWLIGCGIVVQELIIYSGRESVYGLSKMRAQRVLHS